MPDDNSTLTQNRNTDLWRPLCREAYDLLSAHQELLDADQMDLDQLSPLHRGAYLLGCLIGQVRNGGFAQWVGNGYGLRLRETRAAAVAVGTECSQRIVAMLDGLEHSVDLDAEDRGYGGLYFTMTAEEEEIFENGGDVITYGEALCDGFDDQFDEFDAHWELEVNAWLAAGAPGLKSGVE